MIDNNRPARPTYKGWLILTVASTLVSAFVLISMLTNRHQTTIDPPCGDEGLTLECGATVAKTPHITTQDYYTSSSVVLVYAFITILLCALSLRELSKNPTAKSKKSIAAFVLGIPGFLGFGIVVLYLGIWLLSLIRA